MYAFILKFPWVLIREWWFSEIFKCYKSLISESFNEYLITKQTDCDTFIDLELEHSTIIFEKYLFFYWSYGNAVILSHECSG